MAREYMLREKGGQVLQEGLQKFPEKAAAYRPMP